MLSVRGLTKIYVNRYDAHAGGVRDIGFSPLLATRKILYAFLYGITAVKPEGAFPQGEWIDVTRRDLARPGANDGIGVGTYLNGSLTSAITSGVFANLNSEEVDFLWDGRPYVELIGRRHAYDWIIGSHVLEHTTDLLGFLNDCDSLLKKGGVLSLVVPDKRYCFDRFRPLTDVGRVIDAARNPQKFIRPERRLNIFLR